VVRGGGEGVRVAGLVLRPVHVGVAAVVFIVAVALLGWPGTASSSGWWLAGASAAPWRRCG